MIKIEIAISHARVNFHKSFENAISQTDAQISKAINDGQNTHRQYGILDTGHGGIWDYFFLNFTKITPRFQHYRYLTSHTRF